MKKFLFLFLFIVPCMLIAQDFRFGVKGGLNLANYRGEDNGGHFKTGVYAGVFSTYLFSNLVSLQTEIEYSQQGLRDHVDGNSVKTSLDYLVVPLLLQFSLRNYEQFKFAIGPQVGYLLDSKVKTETSSGTQTEHNKSNFEDFDYGAILGMEYELTGQFLIGVRYFLGISEFFDQSKIKSGAKHSVISIGAAYRF